MLEDAKKMVKENPLVEKAEEMKEKLEKEVANNKYVKKAEKMSDKLKKNISETIDDVKGKIEDYTEDALNNVNEKLEDIKPVKTKKSTPKKKVVKKEVAVEEKIVVKKTEVKDDLKVIKGIGPVLEKSLNDLDVTAYEQIAKMTIKNMTKLLTDAGINAKIYDLSGWKAQAKLALKGDMEAVKNWERK
jgi:predicted flap endonuclease-1-like 5' DNA nuclease